MNLFDQKVGGAMMQIFVNIFKSMLIVIHPKVSLCGIRGNTDKLLLTIISGFILVTKHRTLWAVVHRAAGEESQGR